MVGATLGQGMLCSWLKSMVRSLSFSMKRLSYNCCSSLYRLLVLVRDSLSRDSFSSLLSRTRIFYSYYRHSWASCSVMWVRVTLIYSIFDFVASSSAISRDSCCSRSETRARKAEFSLVRRSISTSWSIYQIIHRYTFWNSKSRVSAVELQRADFQSIIQSYMAESIVAVTEVSVLDEKEAKAQLSKLPRVLVKYELFPFHNEIIKTLSVHGNMIVFGSGNENDLIKVVRFEAQPQSPNISYQQVPVHKVINNRQNFIEWSPNGRFLALGSEKVSIWQYEAGQFSRYKEFNDELFEVTAFTWCPNSKKYAVSGINLDLSIHVRNIETDEKLKELRNEHKVVGLIWDPYDKHLASLLASNEVVIYKCASWERSHTINLNLNPSKSLKCTSKRDDRKIDWSPDFRYLLVPALEDRTIPLVVALDRNKQFAVRSIFVGSFSSVNCTKFSPILYEYEGEIINIFATGDNDGNISIWGIGQKFCSKKPFLLLKSHKDENELIEDIEWSQDGKILFASTFKRYLVTAIIEDGNFGRRLKPEEKRAYVEGVYGSVRSFVSSQNQFKIFKFNDIPENQMVVQQPPKPAQEENKVDQKQPHEFVFTQQKVIQTDGKKRIMPAMLVKKDQLATAQSKIQSMMLGKPAESKPTERSERKPEIQIQPMINKESAPRQEPKQAEISRQKSQYKVYFDQRLTLAVLDTDQSINRFDDKRCAQVEFKNNQSNIRVYLTHQDSRELLSSIIVTGKVNYITFEKQILIVYTSQGYLYTFSSDGEALELPVFVSKIHQFKINNNFDILTLSTICDLKVFNLRQDKMHVSTNIFELVAANVDSKETRQITGVIDAISLGDDCSVSIQFNNKKLFVWSNKTKLWSMIQNQSYQLGEPTAQGIADPNSRFNQVGSKEELLNKQFLAGLMKPPILAPVHQFQYNTIYYKKHKPEEGKYRQALLDYIKELVRQRLDNRLRTLLRNHFIDSSKPEFIRQPSVEFLHAIFSIKGDVIEEFKELYKVIL